MGSFCSPLDEWRSYWWTVSKPRCLWARRQRSAGAASATGGWERSCGQSKWRGNARSWRGRRRRRGSRMQKSVGGYKRHRLGPSSLKCIWSIIIGHPPLGTGSSMQARIVCGCTIQCKPYIIEVMVQNMSLGRLPDRSCSRASRRRARHSFGQMDIEEWVRTVFAIKP